MKKTFLTGLLFCSALACFGQSQISRSEYYIDTDPGVGNGIPMTFAVAVDSVTDTITIATGSLSAGYHRVYIRYFNDSGKWGTTASQLFYVLSSTTGAAASAPSIITGEYFVDIDPGTGNGTSFTSSGRDSSTNNISVPTGSLTAGYHRAYIRYLDSLGKWGNTTNALFYVMNPAVTGAGASAPSIVSGEYFVDADPGTGNGTSFTSSGRDSSTDNISIPTGSLTAGYHRAYIRYLDSLGKWGNTTNALFYVMNPAVTGLGASGPSIVSGEYFVDTDPGTGNGTAFTSSGRDSSTNNISIPTGSLTSGYHRAYIRYLDSLGKWGNTTNALFYVMNPLVTGIGASGPAIVSGEYFVDTDPGTGNGTAFTSSGRDSSTNNISVPSGGLTIGYHRAYIRYLDSLGKWGNTTNALFYVMNPLVTGAGASSPSIVSGEYFVDTDPGVGNGTPFASSGPDSSSNLVSVVTVGLAIGGHTAFMRYKDSLGKWGQTDASVFYVCMPPPGPITGPSTTNPGGTIGLSDTSAGSSHRWSSGNTAVATVGSTGVVTGVSDGTAIISYTVSIACGTVVVIADVSVNPLVVSDTVIGASSVCAGSTISLTDATSGGTWSSSNTATATVNNSGTVMGVAAGTALISYTTASSTNTLTVTVNPLPDAGAIAGSLTVCAGNTTSLTETTSGGTWSLSNTAIASVGSTGIITGVLSGIDPVHYSVTNICGTATATQALTVNPVPNAGTITGSLTVCTGNTIMLADAMSGGTWSSSNTSEATVNGTGIVRALATGIDSIIYTVANSCGTAADTVTITVNLFPGAGAISGSLTLCSGNTTALTETTTGGTWSSSNTSIATVGSTGIAAAMTAGVTTVSYTVGNTCGTVAATHMLTVNPTPDAGTITGSPTVCTGNTTTLTDAMSGGSWSSSNVSLATVDGTGMVTGLATGIDSIIYTVANSCGTAADTMALAVNLFPVVGTITGPLILCSGNTITLVDATTGGTWSSSNTSVASVGATGIVTGIAAGIDTIGYSITNTCGTVTDTAIVTVNTSPTAISGPGTVCADSTISLFDVGTGTWSSSVTSIAAINSATGSVTGVSVGTTTISYSTGVGCSIATIVTVNPNAIVGAITGTPVICMVASSAFTDAISGGAWSSSNTGIAAVSTGGLVTGVSAGTAVISYAVTNSCNTAVATTIVTINPLPISGTITGSSIVCATMTISLTDAASPGTWSSSAAGIATVSSAGIVSAITAGTTTINYSVTNTCGTSVASKTVTVSPVPSAGTILGSSTVCVAATDMLTDPAGGVWSSSATGIAIVGSSTGIVTGVSAGTSSISYNVTVSCGSAGVAKVVTVNPLPNAGTIGSTPSVVCAGMVFPLTETVTNGVWSSSEPSLATVGFLTGTVTSIAGGTTVLNYTVTNTCGTSVAHDTITINPLPFAGTIIGSPSVCIGSSITLTDMATGGVWSGSGSAATVSGGIVTGVAPGVDTVKYTVTNVCGIDVAARTIIVNPLPLVQTVTGGGSYCSGNPGLHVGLSASQTGVFYQLLLGASPLGIPLTGTGASLDFGLEAAAGVYTVRATGIATECINEMAGSAAIVIVNITTPTISITARPGLVLGVGQSDTLTANVTGGGSTPTYQWYINNEAVAGAVANVFINSLFFDGDSVSCQVMSSELCGTSAAAAVIIKIGNVGVVPLNGQQKFVVFPNPNNGVFTADLSSDMDEEVHIVVTNIVGEKVNEITTTANKPTEIRLPGAAPGVYFVSASAAGGNYVVKVVLAE